MGIRSPLITKRTSGAKAHIIYGGGGTAEAVPFPKPDAGGRAESVSFPKFDAGSMAGGGDFRQT
jgi:hypothetical protein